MMTTIDWPVHRVHQACTHWMLKHEQKETRPMCQLADVLPWTKDPVVGCVPVCVCILLNFAISSEFRMITTWRPRPV